MEISQFASLVFVRNALLVIFFPFYLTCFSALRHFGEFIAVALDLSKAFGRVCGKALISKLSNPQPFFLLFINNLLSYFISYPLLWRWFHLLLIFLIWKAALPTAVNRSKYFCFQCHQNSIPPSLLDTIFHTTIYLLQNHTTLIFICP